MLFSYAECKEKYKTDYNIKKAIKDGKLFKISPGIYSDNVNVPDTAIIQKKYPYAIFTLNSAFYYQGLTDTIPSYYHLLTNKDATKISDKSVKQSFDNNDSLQLGVETISFGGDEILVFTKERLLVELIRNKNKLPYDYYKEILGNYRKLIYKLNFEAIEDYAERLPKTHLVLDTIQKEVF